MDSMIAEMSASSRVIPLPWLVEMNRLFGRQVIETGILTSARPSWPITRVIPKLGSKGLSRASVSEGEHARIVPPRSRNMRGPYHTLVSLAHHCSLASLVPHSRYFAPGDITVAPE